MSDVTCSMGLECGELTVCTPCAVLTVVRAGCSAQAAAPVHHRPGPRRRRRARLPQVDVREHWAKT
eukprot:3659815-Rhodomonas_salina.1